ncbi:MAG: hypothetical protein J5685_13090 [Clostridiales bacterium]|nr:hypothetical protein [Clostridiales bacterium]
MKKTLVRVTAFTCAMSMALLAAGCSGKTEETTGQTTATTASQTEETTTEATTEETTEPPIPYVELESIIWEDPINWESIDATEGTAEFTNVPALYLEWDFSDDSDRSGLTFNVERDGEELYSGYCPYYGIYTDGQFLVPTNEAGYVIPGGYVFTIYNLDELVVQVECNVIYDEETAPVLDIITHYSDFGGLYHYSDPDYTETMYDYDDFYAAGAEGIFFKCFAGTTYPSQDNVYALEWSYNGEAMEPAEYIYNSDDDNGIYAYFSLRLPDGQTLQTGTYEISITINGENLANETIIVR